MTISQELMCEPAHTAVKIGAAHFGVKHALSICQQVLLSTDGTVTHLLEMFSGQPIVVRKLEPTAETNVSPDHPLYGADIESRRVLLAGGTSGENLVYAETLIATDRLNPRIRGPLCTTSEPIGSVLHRARAETYREILSMEVNPRSERAKYFPHAGPACILGRTYAIFSGRQAVMVIHEEFPCSLFASKSDATLDEAGEICSLPVSAS